jgi:type I restriction enzyme S subunit
MQQLLTGKARLPTFSGDWEVRQLGDIAHIKTGSRNNEDKVEDGAYPFFVRSENVERIDSFSHDCEAILIPGEGRIGEIFHYVNGRFDVHQRVYAITQFAAGISGQYVHLFMCQHFGAWAMQNTVKATVDSLRLPTFQSFEVHFPPSYEEQIAIANVLFDMEAELAALETRLVKTRAIKQAMMQELLTGKTRLIDTSSNVVVGDFEKLKTADAKQPTAKSHNWAINEAVVVAVLAKNFGSEQFPLGRKRCTKLAYLMHRHAEHVAEGYLKKAAGPYNPSVKYKGPEGIAQKNGYIRAHTNGKFSGFVAANNIAKAEDYFEKWYGSDVLDWLEQFRRNTNDDLELLATVDMAMQEIQTSVKRVDLPAVKAVISNHPEWEAKLDREIFSDTNIARAIQRARKLFPAVDNS